MLRSAVGWRTVAGVVAGVMLCLAWWWCGVATAAIEQPFTARFSANEAGAIAITGNTLMTCPVVVVSCGPAQQGVGSGAVLSNNLYTMGFVDADSDAGTFDSSSADVSLPAGAEVLFAGLYYGGRVTAGAGGGAAPSAAARGVVSVRAPGAASYATLGATVYDSAFVAGSYVGFADVTATVAAAGSGSYSVANVQSGTGQDRYAGWSLVIAYRDPGQPPRNLSVFDGLAAIQQGDPPLSLTVSGFTTPLTGPVSSSVGLVAYEGDRGSAGDRLSLEGVALSDAANPVNNVFNSSIAAGGVDVVAKAPSFVNQLGFDADTIVADGVLGNGATSATLQQSTTLDQYLTQVVTLATELLSPELTVVKGVENVSAGGSGVSAGRGDLLRYTVTVGNVGQDAAAGVVVADAVPAGTSFVSGSLRIGGAAVTDAAGDDGGSFAAASNAVTLELGALAVGGVATVSFDVRVDGGLVDGSRVVNVASVLGRGATVPVPVEATSDPVETVVAGPAVVPAPVPVVPAPVAPVPVAPVPVAPVPVLPIDVDVAVVPDVPQAGEPAAVGVAVTNQLGRAIEDVRVVIGVPGADVLSASVEGGRCVVGEVVRCVIGTLGAGERVVVRLRVRPSRTGSLRVGVTVSGEGIETQRVVVRAGRSAGGGSGSGARPVLSLRKVAGVARARPGQVVGYRVVVGVRRSRGGAAVSAARGVRVCDSLPAGLTVLSAPGASERGAGGTVCWRIRALAAGRTRTLRMVARVDVRRPTTLRNVATARASGVAGGRAVVRRARAAVRVVPAVAGACQAVAAGATPRAGAAC